MKTEKPSKKGNDDKMFAGLSKGFLNSGSSGKNKGGSQKQEEIIEVKQNKEEKKTNKLEIPEVQSAMNFNNYLN